MGLVIMLSNGIPGGIRTPDRWLRRPLLYPTELPKHRLSFCNLGKGTNPKLYIPITQLQSGIYYNITLCNCKA